MPPRVPRCARDSRRDGHFQITSASAFSETMALKLGQNPAQGHGVSISEGDVHRCGCGNVGALDRRQAAASRPLDIRVAQERDTLKLGNTSFRILNCRMAARIVVGDPSHISSGTRQRGREAKSDRVSNQRRDNRDCRGCFSGGVRWRTAIGCDDIDAHRHEFGSKPWKPVQPAFGETGFQYEIGAFDVPTPCKSATK